jgi:hypothetical protein
MPRINPFNPSLYVSATLLIVYSINGQVERIQDIETASFKLTDPRTNFESQQPETGDVMIPSFDRPMWQAPFFSHHTRYGDTPSETHVGNAIYVDWDDQNPARFNSLGYPLIVNTDILNPEQFPNLNVAWFVHASSVQELEAKVELTKREYSEKPIIAYLDGRGWPDSKPSWMNGNIWPAIQAYRFPGEPLNEFDTEVSAVVTRVGKYNHPMCLVSRFDDFNGSSTIQNALESMAFYEDWLRFNYFVCHMPFSDRRGNAISQNESLWEWARAFHYAIPAGRPNRYDYWRPSGTSIEKVLENKLGQSRAAIVLEPYLKEDILKKYEDEPDNNDEPELDLDLLKQEVQASWNKYGGAPGGANPTRGPILNEAAWNYNKKVNAQHAGLSKKEGGSNVEQPHTGTKIAHDIIQAKPASGQIYSKMYDVFNDAGVISPNEAEPHNKPERIWIAPVEP